MSKIIVSSALLAFGCHIQPLDVGEDPAFAGTGGVAPDSGGDGGTGATAGEGPAEPALPPPSLPSTDGCRTDEELADFVGVWEGWVEDFSFMPVEPVRLVINGASRDGGICGTMSVGAGAVPAPAQDPDAGYPPGGFAPGNDLYPAFSYTIVSGGAQSTELHVGLASYELWHSWCAIQTPVFDASGDVSPLCVADAGSGHYEDGLCYLDTSSGTVVYGQEKCGLCYRAKVCTCTALGCAVTPTVDHEFSFTLGERDGTPALVDSSQAPRATTVLRRVE